MNQPSLTLYLPKRNSSDLKDKRGGPWTKTEGDLGS